MLDILFGTLIVFAVAVALMSVGVMLGGRPLKGSCGGSGDACPCTDAEKKACASRRPS